MKKLFLLSVIVLFLIFNTVSAESRPSISKTVGKVTITLIGKHITNGVTIPLFRIHTGDISIARAMNKKHGKENITADIYIPSSDSWTMTIARRGKTPKHRKLATEDLPYPMNVLSANELKCIEIFLIYPDDKNINIYFRPIGPKKMKDIFEKLANLLNGVSS